MSRFRDSAHDNLRIWWLPWLLPYLFFSLAADGLHNHGMLPADIPASRSLSAGSSRVAISFTPPTHIDRDDCNCLACQWNSMASAIASLCAALRIPLDADVATTIHRESIAYAISRRRAGRDPPTV